MKKLFCFLCPKKYKKDRRFVTPRPSSITSFLELFGTPLKIKVIQNIIIILEVARRKVTNRSLMKSGNIFVDGAEI